MDPFTVKPLDEAAVVQHAKAVGGRIVVVEDHYQAGKPYIYLLLILLLIEHENIDVWYKNTIILFHHKVTDHKCD